MANKPTRITDTSATLIDNILTNVHNSENKSGILDNRYFQSFTGFCSNNY